MKSSLIFRQEEDGKRTFKAVIETDSAEEVAFVAETYQQRHTVDTVEIVVNGNTFVSGMTEKARLALPRFCDPKAGEGCPALALEQQNRAYWQSIAKDLWIALRDVWTIAPRDSQTETISSKAIAAYRSSCNAQGIVE